ncbi:MAG: lactonase family protein [Lachnospiraceae bacterium]|nr:lactonase family protein [Lachnospiraceae bacterium]
MTTYALVGNWHYKPAPTGFTVYRYLEETAEFTLVEHVHPDVAAGQQALDERRGLVYVCNEIGDVDGIPGAGGEVLALRVDPETGHTSLINRARTLSPAPSYFALDKSGRYGIAVHHSGFGVTTKIRRREDGNFYCTAEVDDTAVTLFGIREDGGLGEVCDVAVHRGKAQPKEDMISHLHCVVPDPEGEMFVVTDKGLHCLYSYAIDRENGKLVLKHVLNAPYGTSPRYCAFHPTLPVFYYNNEKSDLVMTVKYDAKTGAMEIVDSNSLQLAENAGKPYEASDICVSPDGKTLYVSDRGSHFIAVFAIAGDGSLTLIQNMSAQGENPRGFCITPDRRFLAVCNSDSASICLFAINSDGTLSPHQGGISAPCPANIRFLQIKDQEEAS